MKTKNNEMPNVHLHELFVDGLKDILGAERQLLPSLKTLGSAANSDVLKSAFETHFKQTEIQIDRLKSVFEELGLTARGKKCKAMKGLLEEAEEIMEEFKDSPEVLDAALIAAAQKVEHYEIATYGCLVTYAKLMQHSKAEELLSLTLTEEKETDQLLTVIAIESANLENKE